MNTQHIFNPVTRSLLVLLGLAGIGSFMFFSDVLPVANLLALGGIIPVIFGMLGENLIASLFTVRPKLAQSIDTPHQPSSISPLNCRHSTDSVPIEKQAA